MDALPTPTPSNQRNHPARWPRLRLATCFQVRYLTRMNKVAIVSGGTYGIGRAITLTLARQGHSVVAFGIDQRQSEETREQLQALGLSADIMEGDVSSRSDIKKVVDLAIQNYGRVDVLCNNAGIRTTGTLIETDEELWDRTFAVNVKGMYFLTRAVLPFMVAQKSGAIVNMASGSGYGGKGRIAYCASKGAVFAFTRSLAVDHVEDHIRVNAVVPGFTLTGMTESMPPERLAAQAEKNVSGRLNRPEDVARVVCYLASDDAATISGAIWDVGGIQGQMSI